MYRMHTDQTRTFEASCLSPCMWSSRIPRISDTKRLKQLSPEDGLHSALRSPWQGKSQLSALPCLSKSSPELPQKHSFPYCTAMISYPFKPQYEAQI